MLNAEPSEIDFGKREFAAAQVNGNSNRFPKLPERRFAIPVFSSQIEQARSRTVTGWEGQGNVRPPLTVAELDRNRNRSLLY